jgi:hypothetical protein
MALAANKVSLSVVVVVVVVILHLFSAAPFSVHARSMSYGGKIQSTWDDRGYEETFFMSYLNLQPQDGRKYRTYYVLLGKHPNGEAMDVDDKDARRRWYESFLPSTLTDSGEPHLLHCYTFDVNGFLASLTRAEASALAKKPGVWKMFTDDPGPYRYSPASCGFETTASTKKLRLRLSHSPSFVRSRPAF